VILAIVVSSGKAADASTSPIASGLRLHEKNLLFSLYFLKQVTRKMPKIR